MSTVLTVLLWTSLLAAGGFTVDYFLYGLHKDRRVEGWHLLTFTGALALLFALFVVPDFPGEHVALLVLVAAVDVALWWRWALLRRVRREVRRRQKERARG